MREEFEKLVAAGKIRNHQVEPLVVLTQSSYCQHRSWGFGKITALDTVFGRFHIDFPGKPGHSMDLSFAADSLKPLPRDHILVRKAEDLEGLKRLAAEHHAELIKLVLQSYGGKATLDQVQQVLVPDVIAEDWRKWVEAAKREMKKDGHFLLPLKKQEPIVYQVREVSLQDRLMAEFRAAKGLKARLAVGAELLRNVEDLGDAPAAFAEAVAMFNTEIASHQRTLPALALEGIFMRDDLRAAKGLPSIEGELTTCEVWAQVDQLGKVLEQVTVGKHKRALQSFQAAQPDRWAQDLLGLLNHVSAKLCGECVALLVEQGKLDLLKDTLARLISQHLASSELLLWLAKERSDAFADILGPEVFRAMLSAIERDQFLERKTHRLRDYVVDDHALLGELIETADLETAKDLTRALQLSPGFEDVDRRSLLNRIVKRFPMVQSLISGDHARQDTALIVSWESLERRQQEYTELVQKKIPANSRDIAVARSYGDLRENHEHKAAKENQRLLMRRKAELESLLARARGTDFSNPRTDAVSIGTRVQAINLANHHPEQLTILGAWDFDAEKHVISYLSPIAQSLLNRKVGEEVEFELDGVTNRYAIAGIESCQTASSVPPGQTATQAIPSTDAAQAADGAAESAPAASPSPAESMGQAQDQIGQAQNPQQDTSRVELAPSA